MTNGHWRVEDGRAVNAQGKAVKTPGSDKKERHCDQQHPPLALERVLHGTANTKCPRHTGV